MMRGQHRERSDAAMRPSDLDTFTVRPLRVLIVEDHADAAAALAMLAELWGHDVQVAARGDVALEMAAAFDPDVVLLDIGLPGLSGYDVARRLRARAIDRAARQPSLSLLPLLPPLPPLLIAVTGFGSPGDRRNALNAGFDVHLVKPCNVTVIEDLLATRARTMAASAAAAAAADRGGLENHLRTIPTRTSPALPVPGPLSYGRGALA